MIPLHESNITTKQFLVVAAWKQVCGDLIPNIDNEINSIILLNGHVSEKYNMSTKVFLTVRAKQ
jgi:hypothetical protein